MLIADPAEFDRDDTIRLLKNGDVADLGMQR
jgi:hypothetical protein